MIEFLFGWIYKPAYLFTTLDGVMCIIEVFMLFICLFEIAILIDKINRIIKNKRKR